MSWADDITFLPLELTLTQLQLFSGISAECCFSSALSASLFNQTTFLLSLLVLLTFPLYLHFLHFSSLVEYLLYILSFSTFQPRAFWWGLKGFRPCDLIYFAVIVLMTLINRLWQSLSHTIIIHQIFIFWIAAPSLQNRRYSSVARIHSMTIEAPITKVSFCRPQWSHSEK